jgi:hypothetical protein
MARPSSETEGVAPCSGRAVSRAVDRNRSQTDSGDYPLVLACCLSLKADHLLDHDLSIGYSPGTCNESTCRCPSIAAASNTAVGIGRFGPGINMCESGNCRFVHNRSDNGGARCLMPKQPPCCERSSTRFAELCPPTKQRPEPMWHRSSSNRPTAAKPRSKL